MKAKSFFIASGIVPGSRMKIIHVAESDSGKVFWRESVTTKGTQRVWEELPDGIITNPVTGMRTVWFNDTRFRLVEKREAPSVRLPY